MQITRRGPRHALLQEQRSRLELRIGFESPLHWPVEQGVADGEQAHALVVRHEGTDDRARLAAWQAGRRVVHGFVHAVAALHALRREPRQVFASRVRGHHQRQRTRVRGDDHVFGKPPLQTQSRYTKGAVLVGEVHIHRVVARFGNTPGNATLVAVFDLPMHCRPASLVEQRALEGRHHQHRHQVLEHRTAPRQQHRFAAGGGQQPTQGEPAFLRQLTLGNGHETGQARLGSEQVVEAGVQAPVLHVVADGQQVARAIVKEVIAHLGEIRRLPGHAFDARQGERRALASLLQHWPVFRRAGGCLQLRQLGERENWHRSQRGRLRIQAGILLYEVQPRSVVFQRFARLGALLQQCPQPECRFNSNFAEVRGGQRLRGLLHGRHLRVGLAKRGRGHLRRLLDALAQGCNRLRRRRAHRR